MNNTNLHPISHRFRDMPDYSFNFRWRHRTRSWWTPKFRIAK